MAWLHRAAKHDITIIKSASSQCHHNMPLYDWYIIDTLRIYVLCSLESLVILMQLD